MFITSRGFVHKHIMTSSHVFYIDKFSGGHFEHYWTWWALPAEKLLYDMSCHVVMLIPHALLRIDRAPPSSVSLLFCAFALCILRKYLQTNARKPQRLSNFFKTWVVKDFLRIIWVNIGRILVGKLGENCQSSLVFCGYDDWRSDKAENYTRRGTGPSE